ncbi:hypothetical protein [Streptomyces fagopyri]|uniref:hypothetical protein n=1 Tax=Streptomyces fagopyri TaxID=2662397 RepID=UPI00380A64EA
MRRAVAEDAEHLGEDGPAQLGKNASPIRLSRAQIPASDSAHIRAGALLKSSRRRISKIACWNLGQEWNSRSMAASSRSPSGAVGSLMISIS